jgi:hypothetical protein
MSDVGKVCEALSNTFRQISLALVPFAEAAAQCARQLDRLNRARILYTRHHYVAAGKPYGNGYAAMTRWWRQQRYE